MLVPYGTKRLAMKLTINRDTLRKQLDFVGIAIPAKAPDAILENIKIEAPVQGEAKITFTSAGQDTTASASAEAMVEEPGTILFPGKAFAKLVKTLDGVDAEISRSGSVASLACGRYSGNFSTPDPATFPQEIQKGNSPVLSIPRTELLSYLNTLAFAVNKDPAKRQLSAVNITRNGMCSTNGKVSAIISREIELQEDCKEINIPSLIVPDLINVLKKAHSENVDIYEQDAYLIFEMGDERFCIRKISISFPDIFTRVDNPTKEKNDKSITLDSIELKAALNRVALTSDSSDAAVDFDFRSGGMSGDMVVLSSADGNNSSSSESLDAEFKGLDLSDGSWTVKTRFDPDLLKGVLDAVSSDSVEITFCEDLRIPVRIVDEDLILLMMRAVA